MNYPLTKLNTGESARVSGLFATGSMRRRLQDIGIVEGTKIRCVLKSPSGDPAAYKIRCAVIALRSEDSQNVLVSI